MMVVHLYSPDKSRDPLFISNYATVEVTDQLNRIYGVGAITVFGARDYSMRVWLDPDRLYALGLTTGTSSRPCKARTSKSLPACSTSRRLPSRARSK
jgi:Cation/multidrug efflux pump